MACPTIDASEARTASCSVVRLTRVPPYGIVTSAIRSVGASFVEKRVGGLAEGSFDPERVVVHDQHERARLPALHVRSEGGGSGDTDDG